MGDFDGLAVEVHAEDVVAEDAALEVHGEVDILRERVHPAQLGALVFGVRFEAHLPMLADALEGADEEATGAARGVEHMDGAGVFFKSGEGLGGGDVVECATEGLLDDVIDDVIDDVPRGVIDAAGFADFGLFLDGDAAPVGADDFSQESLIDAAEDFDGDVVEEVGGFVVAQLGDELGEP